MTARRVRKSFGAETVVVPSTSLSGMRESGERFAPGETVFLLREVRAGRQIHEIGTRARVLADQGAAIVLHLDGSDAEVVSCPTDDVARTVERAARSPVPWARRAWLRPSTG
jgi:hypothetical protein